MDCKTPKSYKRIQVTAVFIAQEEYHKSYMKAVYPLSKFTHFVLLTLLLMSFRMVKNMDIKIL